MQFYFEDAFTEKRAKQIEEFVEFAFKMLMGTKRPNLIINFESVNTKAFHALCEWEDRPILPREFRITVSQKLEIGEFAMAIFHEIVHVKQMYKGQLKYRGLRAFWEGVEYTGETDYHDLPWEIEAYKMQDEIALKFLETLG